MKNVRAAVLAGCAMAMSGAAMVAQNTDAKPSAPYPPARHHDPAEREARQLQMLTERLKLTPDQVTQMKGIEDSQRAQMMALRQDTSMQQEDKRTRMMAMRQEGEGKIRGALTDEQKPKYDALLARQREHMAHRPDGAGGPATAPAAPPQ